MNPTELLAWVEHERAWAAYTASNSFQDKANKESAAGKGCVDNDAACTRHAAASPRRGHLLDALMDSGSPLWPPSVQRAFIFFSATHQRQIDPGLLCTGHSMIESNCRCSLACCPKCDLLCSETSQAVQAHTCCSPVWLQLPLAWLEAHGNPFRQPLGWPKFSNHATSRLHCASLTTTRISQPQGKGGGYPAISTS
jgi:hypothetical protein